MDAAHHQPKIVIIGGGYAGTVAAIKLLDAARCGLSLTVIEPRAELGRGVAYSTTELVHLVNGTAQIFGLHPDDPQHLVRWLGANGERLGWPLPADLAQSSPPRWVYGSYVHSEINRAAAERADGVSFSHVRDEAVAVERTSGGYRVRLAGGAIVPADIVVLALGVFANGLTKAEAALADDPRYVAVPWVPEALDRLRTAERLLLVGASLSMVDVIASMEARGFRGRYQVVSRRGQMVEGRRPTQPWRDFIKDAPLPRTARELMRRIRIEKAAMAEAGADWQGLPFPLRAHVLDLWNAVDDTERRRFARHLRAFWDVALHRAAPESYAAVEKARADGRLDFAAGSVLSLAPSPAGIAARVRWRKTQAVDDVLVDGVVNCRGHQEHDWRRVEAPLVRQLLASGLVRPHATGFGIDATRDGAVIDAEGQGGGRLFAIGHPLRGVAWESSSIGEQLAQAIVLAPRLLAAVGVTEPV